MGLAIRVDLLAGRYEAALGQSAPWPPEWPPHPFRLYAALVAGAARDPDREAIFQALEWLEALPPPEVWASGGKGETGPWVAVPVMAFKFGKQNPKSKERAADQEEGGREENQTGENSSDSQNAGSGKRQISLWPTALRRFPTYHPAIPTVWMVWPEAVDRPSMQALQVAAARVAYLGRARSPVSLSIWYQVPSDELAGLTCYRPHGPTLPAEFGAVELRVLGPGLKAGLERAYQQKQFMPHNQIPRCFYLPAGRTVAERSDPSRPVTSPWRWSQALVLQPEGPVRVADIRTAVVSHAVRTEIHRRVAERDPDLLPTVTGQGHVPHCAVVPLPFSGSRHGDGRLMGVAIFLPAGLTRPQRRILLDSIDHLGPIELDRYRTWSLCPAAPGDHLPWSLQPGRWIGPTRTWVSVTPVLLGRYLRPREGEEAIIEHVARGCELSGLPRPVAVTVSRLPFVRGASPAGQYWRSRRPGDPARPAVHAWIEFPVPVEGPVLVGFGRYHGLGLFAPVREEEDEVGPGDL